MSKSVLTQERANLITELLNEDEARAKELLVLGPEEALSKINGGLGYDFTLDEIVDYGKAFVKAIKLNDDALSSVAGGAKDDMSEDVAPVVVVVVAAAPKVKAGAVVASAAVSGAVGTVVGSAIGWVAGRFS